VSAPRSVPRVLSLLLCSLALGAALSNGRAVTSDTPSDRPIRIVTLNPGHFHASLVHRERYPDVDDHVHVYAPLTPDLAEHLKRVARFNVRPVDPTRWEVEVHAGPDFLERMVQDRAGNVVVISGRNRGKIDAVLASLKAGFNVLVDKPWILRSEDLSKLKDALAIAATNHLAAFDMMTERFEVTTALQKELVNDPEVFGRILPGSPDQPSVYMESVHHLMKVVAGAPLTRPPWFFDTEQQGEGLSDVGTHLVDLVQWTLFPEQSLDFDKDVRLLAAQRWPTVIAKPDFQRVTGEPDFPPEVKPSLKDDRLEYYSNTLVTYSLRGVQVKLNAIWDWEAPAGSSDSHYAVYRGSKARVEVRQGRAEGLRPETYVVPNDARVRAGVMAAVGKRLAALQSRYPGVAVEPRGDEVLIRIPDRLRTTHEDHFSEVARRFFRYVKDPSSTPAWEAANMLVKYSVTTRGTELSRQSPPQPSTRIAPR
jgi:predicted dehydrogenase